MLIGAWWPAPPAQPTAAVTHWSAQSQVNDNERAELRNQLTLIATSNRGNTADDLGDSESRWRGGDQRRAGKAFGQVARSLSAVR